jgi:hypothetical protein
MYSKLSGVQRRNEQNVAGAKEGEHDESRFVDPSASLRTEGTAKEVQEDEAEYRRGSMSSNDPLCS